MGEEKKKKRFDLSDVTTREVSLVDRGAVGVDFLILKQEKGAGIMNEEILKAIDKIIKGDFAGDTQVDELLKAMDEKVRGAVKAALRLLSAHKDALPGDVFSKLAGLAGYGYADPKEKGEKYPYKEKYPGVKKAVLEAAGEAWDKVADVFKSFETETVEIQKASESPEVVALKKQLSDRDALIKKHTEEIRKSEFVKKAEALKHIGKADEVGPLMMAIEDKLEKADSEKINTLLKSVNEQIEKGNVFGENGSSNKPSGSNAYAEIQKMADVKIKDNPKLSAAEARTLVMRENPDLYSKYEQERAGK